MKKTCSLLLCALMACGDDDDSNVETADAGGSDAGASSAIDAARDTSDAASNGEIGTVSTSAGAACAEQSSHQGRVACAANALLDTLSTSERTAVQFELSDYDTRTKWSNLPVMLKPRAGVQFGSLSAGSQAALLDLMTIALDDDGHATATGILRADDYLGTMQGGYGSDLYSIAILGTPGADSDFEVMFGGHHMAYNLHFVGGGFYPVPQHLGCEPKAAFTYNGGTYDPMASKADPMFAVYAGLTAAQQTSGYLSGQTFSDVVVNPDLDYGKGSGRTSKDAYPTGANRKGVLVSSMTSAQQALVTAAIEGWVRQYPAEVADTLMSDYTGAYDDTYFAWGGDASGPDVDVTGSYLRVDGPRVWIELSVQGGIVIRNTSHYHSIYHDKTYDYGGEF